MTESKARALAAKQSKKGEEMYVVVEPGEGYQTATYYDLETWYAGIREDEVIACYMGGELA